MNNKCNIGVFDSGLGGVSVLKKIVEFMPHENIIYVGDTKNIPYGAKTKEEIQVLSKRIVDFLIKNKCKVIVIACNTATIATIDTLKESFSIPIIGIIEAGIDVVIANNYNEISVFGTRFTIESNEHVNKIKARNKEIKVNPVACDDLCPMIEKGWTSFSNREKVLQSYTNKISKNSKALLLACTHYPFIYEDIRNKFDGDIIDPSEECAKKILSLLKTNNLMNLQKNKGKVEFYVTGNKQSFKEKAEGFLGSDITDIYSLNI